MGGLRYNKNKRKWSYLHFKSLEPIIEVLEYGAHKYTIYEDENGKEVLGKDIPIEEASNYKVKVSGVNNWRKGLNKTEVLESMERHIAALFDGEEIDNESGKHHIGHIGCNYLFYAYELQREKENTSTSDKN